MLRLVAQDEAVLYQVLLDRADGPLYARICGRQETDGGHEQDGRVEHPGLVLFGHLHIRKRGKLPTAAGELDFVCASGASLDHPEDAVRAGYNVYGIERDGRVSFIEAHALDAAGRAFRPVAVGPSSRS